MRGGGGAPWELGGYIPRELAIGGGEPGRSCAHVGKAGRGGISRGGLRISRGGLALAVGGPRLTSPALQRSLRVQGGAAQACLVIGLGLGLGLGIGLGLGMG